MCNTVSITVSGQLRFRQATAGILIDLGIRSPHTSVETFSLGEVGLSFSRLCDELFFYRSKILEYYKTMEYLKLTTVCLSFIFAQTSLTGKFEFIYYRINTE